MRKTILHLSMAVLAGLLVMENKASATIGPSGNWTATTISNTQTVTLTGDVNLKGLITINNGGSLTINMSDDLTGDVMINAAHNFSTSMFKVQTGGQLIINGRNDGARIIIDGGANFQDPVYDSEGYMTKNALGTSQHSFAVQTGAINCDGTLVMQYVTIQNAYSKTTSANGDHGAAILLGDYSSSSYRNIAVTLNHCVIKKCKSFRGCAVLLSSYCDGSVSISNSEIFNCVCDNFNISGSLSTESSGIIRSFGPAKASVYLTNLKIHHNYCDEGGAIHANAAGSESTVLQFDGCEIYKNRSGINAVGTGITSSSTTIFTGNKTKVYENKTDGIGGGIALKAYTANAPPSYPVHVKYTLGDYVEIYSNYANKNGGGVSFQSKGATVNTGSSYVIEINGAKIYGNSAGSNGGGVSFDNNYSGTSNYSFSVEVNSGLIESNTAGGNGGGIYSSKANMTMTGGDIRSNSANNGGGFYISNGDVDISGGTLYNNTATTDGGGFYVTGGSSTQVKIRDDVTVDNNTASYGRGGGCYISGGNVTLSNGTITNNKANAIGGGGLCINGGTTTFTGGEISGNHALDGAGLYVKGGSLSFPSGKINGNTASRNAGGVYVAGGGITFKGNISGNTAKNGGAVYLASGASMTFNGGLITGNNATADANCQSTTAYRGTGGTGLQGCGGGIYLQKSSSASQKTTLSFALDPDDKSFGLYNNRADKAGDDIVAEGQYTSVVLPRISDLQLSSFGGADASPRWYQDYFTGDTGYNQTGGHAVAGSVQTVGRYRNILANNGSQFLEHIIDDDLLTEIHDRYLCLTLGCNMLDIKLTANGLLGHETALFQLIRHGLNKVDKYDILLNVVDGVASRTLKNMPWGLYSVIPNNQWNCEYQPLESRDYVRLGETVEYEFIFDMQHKVNAQFPQHDERQAAAPPQP